VFAMGLVSVLICWPDRSPHAHTSRVIPTTAPRYARPGALVGQTPVISSRFLIYRAIN